MLKRWRFRIIFVVAMFVSIFIFFLLNNNSSLFRHPVNNQNSIKLN